VQGPKIEAPIDLDWPSSETFPCPQVAVIASSRVNEIAFADQTAAIFTRNLIEGIRAAPVPTLHDAFLLAQKETAAEAATRCLDVATPVSADEDCTPQDAELRDAAGVTERMRLGSRQFPPLRSVAWNDQAPSAGRTQLKSY